VAVSVTFGVLALGATVPGGCLLARDFVASTVTGRRPRTRLTARDVLVTHG
jgi:hypothetical protein